MSVWEFTVWRSLEDAKEVMLARLVALFAMLFAVPAAGFSLGTSHCCIKWLIWCIVILFLSLILAFSCDEQSE